VACILARAAAKNPDLDTSRQLEDQAIELLGKAFQQGYGRATAATDPDLRSLQHRSEAQALLRPQPIE
jgi:hypothetical protein